MKTPMRGGANPRNRARRLRANPTDAEKHLWLALRPLRHSHAIHIRRQMPLGPYIADFAIVAQKLIIEVDGGQHGGAADTARDAWMTAQGWRVLRFWNTDIFNNLEGVMDTIFRACGAPQPLSLPVNGEGGEICEARASGTSPRLRGGAVPAGVASAVQRRKGSA